MNPRNERVRCKTVRINLTVHEVKRFQKRAVDPLVAKIQEVTGLDGYAASQALAKSKFGKSRRFSESYLRTVLQGASTLAFTLKY